MSLHSSLVIRCLVIFAIVPFLLLTSCAARHSSRAILYKDMDGTTKKFDIVTNEEDDRPVSEKLVSGNPVYIPSGKVFDLFINEVRPGWIHLPPVRPGETAFTKPALDNKKWSLTQEEFLLGREVWLVVEITQTNSADPLELTSGKYIAASNVKLDMLSHGAVPLSQTEKKVFHLDQDSSYRMVFKLFEVNGLAFKRAIAKVYNNPGLYGITTAAIDTVKQVFTTIVGPTLFHSDEKGTLLLEQALLESDATIEFLGTVNVLRSAKGNCDDKTDFMLYDAVKSDFYRVNKCVTPFSNQETYDSAFKTFIDNCKTIDMKSDANSGHYSYLRFSIKGWNPPTEAQPK